MCYKYEGDSQSTVPTSNQIEKVTEHTNSRVVSSHRKWINSWRVVGKEDGYISKFESMQDEDMVVR